MLEPTMLKKEARFLYRRRYEHVARTQSRSGRLRLKILEARVSSMPVCRLRKYKKEEYDYTRIVVTGTGMGPAFRKHMNLRYWQKPRKVSTYTANFRLALLLMYPDRRRNNA